LLAHGLPHNLIEQGNGLAILLEGNEHLIEKNELHHICMQASDCGAIYSGRDWSWRGNVIRNNYIHEIIGYGMKSLDVTTNQVLYQSPDGARGVYLDDGASGFDVSGNIFENAGLMSLQIGGGRDNKIYNNYFLTNEYAIFIDDRWPTYDWNQNQINLDASSYKTAIWQQKYPELAAPMHNKTWPEGNRIERNILVSTRPEGNSLGYLVPMDSTVIADNLIWSTTGEPTVDYKILEENKTLWEASWAQWTAEKIEQGSIVADPCVTISNKKMATCPDSPVKDIGFDPLPADIGLI
jgi:parallel beta-helix repeat protein